jgi:hypothetical protein
MKRNLSIAVLSLLSLLVATSAYSLPCQSETITFWGYNMSDGSVRCTPMIISPQPVVEVVGQITYACDGRTYSWGNTSCEYYPPTYEYEDCGCEYVGLNAAKNQDFRKGTSAKNEKTACKQQQPRRQPVLELGLLNRQAPQAAF